MSLGVGNWAASRNSDTTDARGNIRRIAHRSDLPESGRWKFRLDPCQTARSVEHVMAVGD
jgi:hypothetical protein